MTTQASMRSVGEPEWVASIDQNMPTGVAISGTGRMFVSFPRWDDEVPATVAELRDGAVVPYPSPELTRLDTHNLADHLVSVQSVVVDPADRLWLLDTGSIQFGPTSYGGPKLVCVDLTTDEVTRTILFPDDVALRMSYVNDLVFDLRRGEAGYAFITDSAMAGNRNGIIVVDLADGRSWRKLDDHPSTKAVTSYLPMIEGRPFLQRPPGGEAVKPALGSDGIAISADGSRLYYCPFLGRELYSVSVDALVDEASDEVATVVDEGDKGGGTDGLDSDAEGRLYVTSYEHNAVAQSSLLPAALFTLPCLPPGPVDVR
jgi:sugar lactone lactonase YvrE